MSEERAFDRRRFRRHELAGGWIAIVGRSAEDNDDLSLRLSEPQDYWFHVCGCPGSHVLLLHRPDLEPPREILEQAAALAAWYSKARAAGEARVTLTRAGQVSKSHGLAPGQVLVQRERILKVVPGLPPEAEPPRA